MTASELKERLYARHPGHGGQMPGAWTCLEEWRCIDLLAFSAWSSAGNYARVGYEVKVTRADLRRELLAPTKRVHNVEWCNEFYFAVPKNLLTPDELKWDEPNWALEDWRGERCPGFAGSQCAGRYSRGRRSKTHFIYVAKPTTDRHAWGHEYVKCPTCDGKGVLSPSRVEAEAPTCWIPRDVGLVEVDGRGTRVVRKSPRRKEVPALSAVELGQLVRWVSMRPDRRHHPGRSVTLRP